MRIYLICLTSPWSYNGMVESHTWNLALAMSKIGHLVYY